MYAGDEFYGDEITSPTMRPNTIRPLAREDEQPTILVDEQIGSDWTSYRVSVAPGVTYGGWRITGAPIYAGFDYMAIAYIQTVRGVSLGDLVRSEHGAFYLRPHHSPHGGQHYNKWLYPIEPA